MHKNICKFVDVCVLEKVKLFYSLQEPQTNKYPSGKHKKPPFNWLTRVVQGNPKIM